MTIFLNDYKCFNFTDVNKQTKVIFNLFFLRKNGKSKKFWEKCPKIRAKKG